MPNDFIRAAVLAVIALCILGAASPAWSQNPELVLSVSSLTITEGSSASYTVKLEAEPTTTLTVYITGTSGTDLTLNEESLTFTTDNWNSPQTVTVSAGEDGDEVNDNEKLRHVVFGDCCCGRLSGEIPVTVVDNEKFNLVLSPASLTVDEGESATYTVKLALQPTGNVTVTIGGTSGTDLSLNRSTLTFSTGSWNSPQAVRVTARQDDDRSHDSETITHTASGGGYGSVSADLPVTVTDDDVPDLVLSPASLTIEEGRSGTYTVRLAARPDGDVGLTVDPFSGDNLTLDKYELTFTTNNWNNPQTVRVTAGQDPDGANETAGVWHAGEGGGYGSVFKSIHVDVTDDDTPDLVLSERSLTINEGENTTYTVKLAIVPTEDVTVSIGGWTGTDLSLNNSTLTFDTNTWNTPQTVRVTAGTDMDGINDSETLTHTARGGGYGSVSKNLPVTVTDKDAPNLLLSRNSLTIDEGNNRTYTVKLATLPTGNVSVTIGGTSGTDLDLDKTTLTFTTTTWNSPQTVRVTVGQDDDGAEDTATLTHRASNGGYGGVSKDLPVTVTDNDTPDLLLSTNALGINENESETYTVKLATKPTGNVTVTIGGFSGTDLSLNTSTLRFNTNNWNSPQTVRVTARPDMDNVNDRETLTHTASGADYGSVSKNLPVTVTDDDVPNLLLSPGSLTIDEGNNRTYTVKLATLPTGDVTVSIGGWSGTDLTLDKDELTFTTNTWNTRQTVRVTAEQDDDGAEDSETLTHRASGGGYGSINKGLPVTVTDNDTPDLLLSEPSLTINEGENATYTVELATQPTATITVTIGGWSGTDLSLNNSTLTFTRTTWGSPQTVRVTTLTDTDGANDSETLTHTAAGGDYGSTNKNLPVTVTDKDAPNLLLSPGSLMIDEGDDDTYTVELATLPSADVTVSIRIPSGTDLELDKTSLTFTTTTWNSPQTVRVTAGQDPDGANDSASLTHRASGGDYGSVSRDLPVTVTDNDPVGLILSEGTLGVNEGESATYTVELATQPTGNVTVTIGGWSGTDLSLNRTSVTFTRSTWNSAQTVRVTARTDADMENDSETLTHTASGADYGSVTKDLSVTVTDKDVPNLFLSPGSLTIDEGDNRTYTVKLATLPTGDVTVTIAGTSGTDLTLDKDELTFTTTTWNSPQTVRVTADEDTDKTDDRETLTHMASGGGYGGVNKSLPVTVTDDDAPRLVLSRNSLTINEGGSGTYTVRLGTVPTGDVTVTIGGTSGTDLSLNNTTLTFDTNTWNSAQTVRVTANQDPDTANDSATLTHTATGGGYQSVTKYLSVRVTDNDTSRPPQRPPTTDDDTGRPPPTRTLTPVTVSFERASYTAAEGVSGVVVRLRLDKDPKRTVSVPLTVSPGGGATTDDFTGVPKRITFRSGETKKSFTVTPTDDDVDDDGESLTLGFGTLPRGVGAGTPSTTLISLQDDDDPEVALSFGQATYEVAEGGDAVIVRLRLSADPERRVTIPLSVTPGNGATEADYRVVPLNVTFTGSTIETTVEVTAVDDDMDDDGESLTLGFANLPRGVRGGTPSTTLINLQDDDDPEVTVSFGQATYEGAEGGGAVVVRLRLSADPERKVTIPLSATPGNGATDADFSGVPEAVVFNSGETEKDVEFTVVDDDVDDDGETLRLHIGIPPHRVNVGSPSTTLVSLADDDDPVVAVSFGAAEFTAEEGGRAAAVRVRLSADPERQVTIPLSVTPGNGATEADYRIMPSNVTLNSGVTETTVEVTAVDDDVDDDGETLVLGFGIPPHRVNVGSPSTTLVSLADDDDPAVAVSFGAAEYTAEEGGRAAAVRVRLSADPERQVTIPLSVTPGNGATEADYRIAPSNVTLNSGVTETTVEVTAVDDDVDDDGEILVLGFGALPQLVNEGRQTTATVRMTDDDERGVIVSVTELMVPEGDAGSYTVALGSAPTGTVTIEVTGMADSDVSVDPTRLTFTARDWDAPQEVVVRAHDDDDAILDQVTLHHATSGGDYGSVSAPSVLVTVVEDDTPTLAVLGQRAYEYAGAMEFTVFLDIPTSDEVTVKYATSNGTAVAGEDYRTTQGTLRFAALQTRQKISVPIIDDNIDEDAETFKLTLTEPSHATLRAGWAATTGTIDDNDSATDALQVLLSSVGRMVATDVIDVVSGRFDQPAEIEPALTLGGLPAVTYEQTGKNRSQYATGSRFNRPAAPRGNGWIPLETQISHPHGLSVPASFQHQAGASDLLSGSDFEMPLKRAGSVGSWVLWGQVTLTGFSSLPNAIRRMDADGFTGYLGVEYRIRKNLLLGLALTHSRGDLDYDAVKTRNTLVPSDYGITSVLPYVHFQVRPGLGVWGLAGFGRGSSDMSDFFGFVDADMTLMMGAGGARQDLSTWYGIGFAVKGDAFYVNTRSDGGARLPDVLVEAKRVRLMLEGRRTLAFDPVMRLTPSLEIGLRWDRGHVENGAGIDVGGGFQLAHSEHGVSLSTQLRYLLVHQQDAREEWGISLILRVDPGMARQGVVLNVSPVWGAPGSGPEAMWHSGFGVGIGGPRGPERTTNVRPDRIEFNVGYQLLALETNAMVTPYGGWTTGVHGFQSYRLGSRLVVGRSVDMNLEGMRHVSAQRPGTYGFMLRGRMSW